VKLAILVALKMTNFQYHSHGIYAGKICNYTKIIDPCNFIMAISRYINTRLYNTEVGIKLMTTSIDKITTVATSMILTQISA